MPIYSPTGFLDITNATLRTSNVEAENLLLSGGNIYVTSELETDATVLNLENVTRKGNVSSNTIEITNATTGIWAAGNVHASKFIGSGEYLTGIPPSAITGTLSQWSDGTNGDVYIAGGVGIANVHTLTSNTLQVGGNLYVRDTGSNVLTVDGNVVANYFEGDGSKLSGIVTDLQGVTDNGNTTTNVVQFSNVTTGLVTTANIEVGGDLKVDGLTAGKIPYVGADKFLKDSFITTTGDTTVITSNLDVTGNIFMRGDKFIVHSESKLINDAIVGIANNNTVSTTDKGIIMQNTAGNVAIIHHGTGDGFADQLTFGYTDDPLDTVTVTNDLTKELTVNILGNVITQNNLSIGGLLKINTISAASSHSLEAVTNLGNVTSNTVQFSNAITSLVASSNIVASGNVSAGHDTNTTSYFGRAAVGYMGQDDQASFAHVDHNDPTRYAIKQTALGPTYINTPAAGHIGFTVNDGSVGAEKMRITSAGKVGLGVTSPDATLHVAGNAYVSSNLTVSGNVEVGTANLFVDTTTGNVGIGTTSPGAPLEVRGPDVTGQTNGTTSLISRHVAGGDGVLNIFGVLQSTGEETIGLQTQIDGRTLETDITDGWIYSTDARHTLVLQPYRGNVGIATTSPRTTLHVTDETDITGTGDAFISGLTGNTGNRKPAECLRLQGKWYSPGSGALLRFTNQHPQGTFPNAGEYNLAGIAGYDHDNNWGGGLAFYTSPGTGTGGDDLTLRMSIDSIGAVNIPGPTTGANHGPASMLYLLDTPLIKEWQWTGSTNNTLRVTFSASELPTNCKAIYADVFMPQHSANDHVGHALGKNHGQQTMWTGGRNAQPSTAFGNMALQQCFLSMPGQSDNFEYYFGNWWNSCIIPLDTQNRLYHTVSGESPGTQSWIYMVVKGYFH